MKSQETVSTFNFLENNADCLEPPWLVSEAVTLPADPG